MIFMVRLGLQIKINNIKLALPITNFKVNSSSDMEAYAAKTLLLNFAWVHGLPIH